MAAHGTIRPVNRAFLKTFLVASMALLCSAATLAEKPADTGAGAMRAVIEQFTADNDALEGTYTVRISPVRFARFEKFFSDEQARLQAMNFDALSEEDKIDYLVLRNYLTADQHRLAIEEKRAKEMEPLIPFAKTIEDLAGGLRTMKRPDPEKAAGALNEMVKQIAATQKTLDPTPHKGPQDTSGGNTAASKINPIVAYRAERAVEQLSESLKKWFDFYNSYDPAFTWWLGMPYKEAQKSLTSYRGFLKEKLVGIPDDDKTTIIGDPVGQIGRASCRERV